MLTVVALSLAWHSPAVHLRGIATAPTTYPHLRTKLIALAGANQEQSNWDADEDEALLVSVPAFTVGDGTGAVTFWSALAAGSPLLARRTARQCEDRMSALATTVPGLPWGPPPPVLERWQRIDSERIVAG